MSNHPSIDRLPRRTFLTGAVGGASLLLARAAVGAAAVETTIEIAQGKLRGYRNGDVHVFKGVPYGASPAGAGRFKPPRAATPWSGVRDATRFGPSSVQTAVSINYAKNLPSDIPPMSKLLGWGTDENQSEDCLVLNLWTPGLGDSRKRPVMFRTTEAGSPSAPARGPSRMALRSRGGAMSWS